MPNTFVDAHRKLRAALIAGQLKNAPDSHARELIQEYKEPLDWADLEALGISDDAWVRVNGLGIETKLVFCHPDVLRWDGRTSLYYRGISTLSLKAIKDYAGSVNNLERMDKRKKVQADKAKKLARAYNEFTSAIIEATDDWSTDDGDRQIIANLGITLDGVMRNKIGQIAEKHIREMLLERLVEQGLVLEPQMSAEQVPDTPIRKFRLAHGIEMIFSSEPDVFFRQETDALLVCTLEIKGGTDPAAALERYGAGKKSLEAALAHNPRCKNFFLSAVFTDEMNHRIAADRLIERSYNIVELLEDKDVREGFFRELFVYTLRLQEP